MHRKTEHRFGPLSTSAHVVPIWNAIGAPTVGLCLNSESTLLATCGNDRKVTTWNLPHCSKAKELSLDGWVRARRSSEAAAVRFSTGKLKK